MPFRVEATSELGRIIYRAVLMAAEVTVGLHWRPTVDLQKTEQASNLVMHHCPRWRGFLEMIRQGHDAVGVESR